MLHAGVIDAATKRLVSFKLKRIQCSGCLFDHRLGSWEFKELECYIGTLLEEFLLEFIKVLGSGILKVGEGLWRRPNVADSL